MTLKELIDDGCVFARATVYSQAKGATGLEKFLSDLGNPKLKEEAHYSINPATETKKMFAYTGMVAFSKLDAQSVREVRKMTNKSHSRIFKDNKNVVWIYSNILFRKVVEMGVWSETDEEKGIMCSPPHSSLHETDLPETGTNDILGKIENEIKSIETKILEYHRKFDLADKKYRLNKSSGFHTIASEWGSKASIFRRKIKNFEKKTKLLEKELNAEKKFVN